MPFIYLTIFGFHLNYNHFITILTLLVKKNQAILPKASILRLLWEFFVSFWFNGPIFLENELHLIIRKRNRDNKETTDGSTEKCFISRKCSYNACIHAVWYCDVGFVYMQCSNHADDSFPKQTLILREIPNKWWLFEFLSLLLRGFSLFIQKTRNCVNP